MAETTTENKGAVIDFGDAWFNETKANAGGGFSRHPWGEYRWRVEDAELKSTEGSEPDQRIFVTYKSIALIGEGDLEAVGSTHTERYGTTQSKKFLQERCKQMLDAFGLRGKFSPSDLVGRELDATIVWTLGTPKIDENSGATRTPVYANMCHERAPNAKKPASAPSAKSSSAAAVKHLAEENGEEPASTSTGHATKPTPAWEQSSKPAGAAVAVAQPGVAAQQAGAWIPETEVVDGVHAYRALIAMGHDQAPRLRQELAGRKINPDGPIIAEKIPEPQRAAYVAWKAKQSGGNDMGLPSLDMGAQGTAKPGTRTPAPASA